MCQIDKNYKNYIINSQVSVIRNFDKYSFVDLLVKDGKQQLEDEVIGYLQEINFEKKIIYSNNLSYEQKYCYYENGLLEKSILNDEKNSFIIFPKKKICISFNVIDHMKIESIDNGLKLKTQYKNICFLENELGNNITYSASPLYGYLSPCLENCGLGMQLSALLHLPCTSKSENFNTIKEDIKKRGYELKPWIHNAEESTFFLISSKINYGLSEEEFLDKFKKGIYQILDIEKKLLLNYYNNKSDIDDMIYRSYGILMYAKQIELNEALLHISNILIGLASGIVFPLINIDKIYKIINGISESNIAKYAKKDKINNKLARACFIRNQIKKGE